MSDDADSFLSRWSRRKAGVRAGVAVATKPMPVEATAAALPQAAPALPVAVEVAVGVAVESESAQAQLRAQSTDSGETPPPPTLADVALLTRDADYTRYLGGNVSPEVKNAALKHLFSDPHFNVMDGLDTYIGDYNTPDPLPAGMLRQMVQSQLLGLFDDEVEAETLAAEPPLPLHPTVHEPDPTLTADTPPLAADENPDLQLQPDHDAGRPGVETGAGAHAGRPD